MSTLAISEPTTRRETVRFYLLDHRTPGGKLIDIGLLVFNLCFVALFVIETYPLAPATDTWLWRAELGLAALFAAEYGLRLYGARDRLGEATDPYTMVDLVSILPTFAVILLPQFVAVEVAFLRALRVLRVLRFYRFTRDREFFFGRVDGHSLRVAELLLTLIVLLVTAAGTFYTVEYGRNPAVNTFGDAFYYTVVALTTVGFGDITPVTTAGRLVTVGSILAGIVVIPWQASRIVREWATRDQIEVTCPNCGLRRHDRDASHCKACGHVIYQEYESSE